MRSFLLSTVGTSLLTNHAGEQRGLLFRYANAATPEDVPSGDRTVIEQVIDSAETALARADEHRAREMSAELNGILAWIRDAAPASQPHHLLIATDTWLGSQTARLVSEWLRAHQHIPEVLRARDVQTGDYDAFRMGINELLGDLARRLPGYRDAGYRVVFNLTGGFKGVNGFLQAVGSVYADEIVYLFERGAHLLRIPRLPVQLDPVAVVRPHLRELRRLSLDLPIPGDTPLHEVLVDRLDDEMVLSPMGRFLFEAAKGPLYQDQVHPSPSSRVRFGPDFLRSVGKLDARHLANVNTRIDQLSRLAEDRRSHLKGLDLKALKGAGKKKMPPSTHELDLWADGATGRAFLHQDPDGAWMIDRHAPALH